MQGVRGAEHLPAPAPQEQMQGVRGGEHLPAPAPKEQMQGVRGREHYSHQHFRSRHVDASRPGGARVSNAWCWSRPVTFHMTRVKHIFAGRRWTLRHRDRHTHTLAMCPPPLANFCNSAVCAGGAATRVSGHQRCRHREHRLLVLLPRPVPRHCWSSWVRSDDVCS